MGIVSFIPLFNWTAWALPAVSHPERSALYWSFAALYAAPLLRSGFDIDSYTITMLMLGAVHVQVERLAQTEPETLHEMQPLVSVARTAGLVTEKVGSFVADVAGVVAADAKQLVRGKRAPAEHDFTPPVFRPRSSSSNNSNINNGNDSSSSSSSWQEARQQVEDDWSQGTSAHDGEGDEQGGHDQSTRIADELEKKQFGRVMLEREIARLQSQQLQQGEMSREDSSEWGD